MMQFIKEDRGAVTVDWVVLTAALVGLGLASLAVVSGGVENISGDIAVSLADDSILDASRFSFDLGSFAFLTDPGGTPNWQDAVDGFSSEGEYYSWLEADLAGSLDNGNSDLYRAQLADDYAMTYAAAQAQGLDLSGYDDPRDVQTMVASQIAL